MWLVGETLGSIATAFAKVDGDSEGGGSGGDVDGRSTSEIETAKDEGPAIAVPCPAGDGVIHKGRPDEDEDHHWAEFSSLGDGTNGEHRGDGSEHELVDAEDDRRETAGAHRRAIEYA